MKKLGTIAIMVFVTMMLANMASAELITTGSSLEVELLNYQPVPAQPGDTLDVWIKVNNVGGSASEPGTLTILDGAPFSVPENEQVNEFTSIPAQKSALIKTRVIVDKNANEGTNYLSVRAHEKESSNSVEEDLPITIQGRSSALTIVEAKTEPKMVTPGAEATFSIMVKNVGDTKLRNVDMSLDLTDLSFAPTTGSNAQTISSLEGGKSATFTFGLTAFPNIEANVYQIPMTINYEDEQGNSVSQEKTVGISVGSKPELLVYFERNGLSAETGTGDVVIKFVNKGLSQIKLLEMEVEENDEVQVLSESPKLYVGNIDTDDYETADLTLKIADGHANLPLKVSYRDALNNEYEETYTLPIDAKNGTGSNGNKAWIWILVIVIAGAFFWWWHSKSGKRKR